MVKLPPPKFTAPPFTEAKLPVNEVLLETVTVAPASICRPPPTKPAWFPDRVAPSIVRVPPCERTPPPEPVAILPLIVPKTFNVPPKFSMPPLLKEAALDIIEVDAPIFIIPPLFKIPPPLEAVLLDIIVPEIVVVVAIPLVLLSTRIPPPIVAVLFVIVPPDIFSVSVSVTYRPRPVFPESMSTSVSCTLSVVANPPLIIREAAYAASKVFTFRISPESPKFIVKVLVGLGITVSSKVAPLSTISISPAFALFCKVALFATAEGRFNIVLAASPALIGSNPV